MATIGLDKIYYATITEATAASTGVEIGDETYGTPVALAGAIKADLSVEYSEGTLYGDDALKYIIKNFKSGKLSLGIDDIGSTAAAALTGAVVDQNKVLVNSAEDNAPYVAIGFRAKKANGKYRYFWLYRVKFGVPGDSLETQGDGVKFATKTIEGTIMQRNKKSDAATGAHPWKAQVDEDEASIGATTISGWYSAVYEPDFTA